MSTTDKPLIVVLGATGAQGGSVIKALLQDGSFRIRGVSRDLDSEASKVLMSLGVEMVVGNTGDLTSLLKAFQGAWGVYGVTAFWDSSVMGKELQHGKNINQAVKVAGVKRYIFSSLVNVEKISNKKWDVPHFTDKSLIEDNAREMGLNAVFLAPAFFLQNFNTFFKPEIQQDGTFVFNLPLPETEYLTTFDVHDIGITALNVFLNWDAWKGKFIPLAGDHLRPTELVKTFTEVTGKKAIFKAIPLEDYAKLKFPGASELAQMFGWFVEFGYYGTKNPDLSMGKKLNPKMKTWKEWLSSSGFGQQKSSQ